MTQQDKIEVWYQVQPIAVRFANQFAKQFRIPFQELHDLAIDVISEELFCRDRYDSRYSSAITWLFNITRWKLTDYCTKKRKPRTPFSELSEEDGLPFESASKPDPLDELMRQLSDEAQFLVRLTIDPPDELFDDVAVRKPKTAAKRLKQYLSKSCLWSDDHIQKVWSEIEQCLQ